MNTKGDLRMGEDLTLFEDKQIRHIYDEEKNNGILVLKILLKY